MVPQESISNIGEEETIVFRNPTAADILSGRSAESPNDTTGGTPQLTDKVPTDVKDTPTETDVKKGLPYVIIGIIVIGIITAIIYFRRK